MAWEDDLRAAFPDWQTDLALDRWREVRQTLSVGQSVTGEVVARAPFGVWVNIGVSSPALLLVPNMLNAKTQRIAFDDYPAIGSRVSCRIKILGDRDEIGLTQNEPSGPA